MNIGMNEKTVLITGGTDGIGKETAVQLARMGARVLIHGRDQEKGARVIEEINHETCNERISLYLADFSSLAEIQRMADDIKREQKALHVLINNAGNYYKERKLSQDGYEMTFAVNYLAPFLLTYLLLDLIKASSPARIVNVSSSAHRSIKEVDLGNLQGASEYSGFTAYCLSKLGNVLFTISLAERLKESGVTVNSLHPGTVDTNLLRRSFSLDGVEVEEGAKTSVYLASSPDVASVSGKYFDHLQERSASDLSKDKKLQDDFWNLTEEMVRRFLN